VTRVVIDTNLAVALVVPVPYSEAARGKVEEWRVEGAELLAPALWGYEVTSTLRKATKLGRIKNEEARAGLEAILDLGVTQVAADKVLHARALLWAERLGATVAYDAAYLALAEARKAELWTADQRLVRAAESKLIDWVRGVAG